ncbi:UNVERIFIED_CONTAM: hypothetical protein FKN15_007181 [Acipenser sinensis]
MDTQQKAKLADLQIEQLNRMKKHAHLTDSEVTTLPDETRMYEGVGRMIPHNSNWHREHSTGIFNRNMVCICTIFA